MPTAVFLWRGARLSSPPPLGIGPANDIPIARRRVARRQAEQFFERRMPVKAAIVAKDEFVEICIDMLAAQAVIRAQSPPLHQREDPVIQGNTACPAILPTTRGSCR